MNHGPQSPFSDQLHAEKYRLDGETFRDAMSRVAGALTDGRRNFDEFRDILLDMRFLPAGRIQAAVGSPKRVTPYNCFVSGTIEDSFTEGDGSIMQRAAQAAETMRMGGGIGYDFSTLRPRGSPIKKLGSRSSGPISFMEIFDAICRCVASSGHRRGAQMGVMRIDHPDIEAFVRAKQNTDKLTGFNLSIAVTDEFMHALRDQRSFALRWGGQTYAEIDPAALWESIMRATWDWAEPGVLFIDAINRANNLRYCENIAATNPCVTGDTLILTSDGWREIATVVGQGTCVWNGTEWSTVVPKVTGLNQEILRLSFSSGMVLECTPYHKFVLADGSRVEARDLSMEHRLAKWELPVIEGNQEVEDAWEQGFFQGDGWFDQRGRAWIGLFGAKKKLLPHFQTLSVHEYSCSGFEGTDTSETSLRLYLGKDAKRSKDFVPGCEWSVRSRLEWLAGIFDADGCVVQNSPRSKGVQLSAKSEDLVRRICLLLATLGCHATMSPMKGCWRTGISASDLLRLGEMGLRFRRLDVSNNDPQRVARHYVKLISVERVGRADKVYCFTEPKAHTGMFGGVMTAQCGEQPLPPFGACLLGSFNLVRYVRQKLSGRMFNEAQLREDIPHVVRAMDRVIDVATYPLPQQETEAKSKRRMGLGFTGVANALEACGLPYGSQRFCEELEHLLMVLNREAYLASVELAKEKGSFPLFDAERYGARGFASRLDEDVREQIRRFGIRNSHLTSIAPTGTISLCADNVSSGIEPVFASRYERTMQTPDGPVVEVVEDYGQKFLGHVGRPAAGVTVNQHLNVLLTAAHGVDSAVSKTCNVPPKTPWEEFKSIYVAAWVGGAKGCTTFTTGGKRFGVLSAQEDGVASCRIDPVTGAKECGE